MTKRKAADLLRLLWERAYPPGRPMTFNEVWEAIQAATTKAELDKVVAELLDRLPEVSDRESLAEAAVMRRYYLPCDGGDKPTTKKGAS